jgi:hypothetical protein
VPIHVVAAYDKDNNMAYVVTEYIPGADIWSDDFKTRR